MLSQLSYPSSPISAPVMGDMPGDMLLSGSVVKGTEGDRENCKFRGDPLPHLASPLRHGFTQR